MYESMYYFKSINNAENHYSSQKEIFILYFFGSSTIDHQVTRIERAIDLILFLSRPVPEHRQMNVSRALVVLSGPAVLIFISCHPLLNFTRPYF